MSEKHGPDGRETEAREIVSNCRHVGYESSGEWWSYGGACASCIATALRAREGVASPATGSDAGALDKTRCPEPHEWACTACGTELIDPSESDDAENLRLTAQLEEADAVIAGHWYSHRIDGSRWRLEDQARPVREAIQRHLTRQKHAPAPSPLGEGSQSAADAGGADGSH